MQTPDIIQVGADHTACITDILADAFAEDPCMNWVIPHVGLYPGFYTMLARRLYMPHGLVFMDSEARAAAMWLPPGVDHRVAIGLDQLLLVIRLLLHSGTRVLPRLEQAQEVMARRHPREPHYYLHAIGARRGSQGLGLGSALIKQVTRRCDEERMPAYLESSSPLNIPLYQRHGFEIQDEEPIGEGGPPLTFMWREPRQAQ
ncbi:MAG: GNAT family N-acetyltransferase [Halieaceae bacterium]|nr:GNAT family N-acetyltransferase [Halieaceae bacterium]